MWLSSRQRTKTLALVVSLSLSGITACKGTAKKTESGTSGTAAGAASLQSLSIYASSLDGKVKISFSPGGQVQLQAIGLFSDASTTNLATSVTWTSTTTAVCTVSNAAGTQGRVTAVDDGTCTITAALGSVNVTRNITVIDLAAIPEL